MKIIHTRAYPFDKFNTVAGYTAAAIGRCDDCGRDVYLDKFTNTCECGADYNMGGVRLAPRECWGEETGESISDILSVDSKTPEELLS